MSEEKDMDIEYISSKEDPAEIITKNYSEADHSKNVKGITEG